MKENKASSLGHYMTGEFRKNRVFMLRNKTEKPSMIKVSEQGHPTGRMIQYCNSYSLPAEAVIYDIKTKTNRVIRYVIGEESIYKDLQSQSKDIPVKIQKIEFIRGMLSVRPEEPTLLELLINHPRNESNPNRDKTKTPIFFEYRPEIDAEDLMVKDKTLIEAKNWCHTATWNELRMHATVLGINTDQSPDEVKWHILKGFAEVNPVKFLEGLKDKSNRRKYTVIEAIKNEVLIKNVEANSINWNGGALICLAPLGIDPIVHLVDQTFADTRGEELYRLIEAKLNPVIIGAPEDTEDKYKIKLPEDAEENLINSAIAAGIVIDKTPWFFYKEQKWQGKKNFIKELNSNEQLKTEIVNAVSKLATA